MELRRTLNNKIYLFCIGIIGLSFVLGYFLLVGIDKIDNVTIKQLYFSTYTVIVQFGPMIYPFIILLFTNSDYKEKNILFFRTIGITPLRFFLEKFLVMLLWFTTGIIIPLICVSFLYNDWSIIIFVFCYFEIATIHILILSSFFAFIVKNILTAFGLNLLIWVGSIVTFTICPLKYIAYFDASNTLYLDFEKFLETSNFVYFRAYESLVYIVIEFIIVIFLILLFSKKWLKNGV